MAKVKRNPPQATRSRIKRAGKDAKPRAASPAPRQAAWLPGARGRLGRALRWAGLALLLVVFLPAPLLLVGRFVPTWYTPLMILRLAEGEGLNRQWAPLEELPVPLRSMALASEDQLFCSHGGFDWKALERQLQRVQAGESARGASTISQQTAKNLFLWDGRSWLRKGLEAWYTLQLELIWPKRRIIEVYLNIAEMGPGVYGAAAAARHWFGKDLAAMSRLELARIIAILPAPRAWRAEPASANLQARARQIDARARALGELDACVR
jgi:monofunctional biosynthetic peptidoglycan transglycosylase